jgi:mannose/fructose/N-acetylgalactosamine-specific phosphotransferase system component IIC
LAKVTLVFALLLVALGLVGYVGTGSQHATALIPAWIGLALGIFGFLAISPDERQRKLFMHINVTIALLLWIGTCVEITRSVIFAHAAGKSPDPIAMESKEALAFLLLFYVLLCVRSFVIARRKGKV